jgi:hypothetical protein
MRKNNQGMEEEAQTWRDLLGRVATRPKERHRIAATLRINSITITRWIAGTSNPRIETLRALPRVLPQYREQLITLLKQEYPDLFTNEPIVDMQLSIPSDFYRQVLNTYAMDPERLRISSLAITILQQIIFQFDPDNSGFAALIAQCVAPTPGHKVRSLRVTLGYGGPSSTRRFINQTCFCGTESQAGRAALSAHPIIVQNPEDEQRIIPDQYVIVHGSSLAIPLLQYDCIAGCACFVSPQRNYFSPERIGLLKHYANLLTTAFEQEEFYPLSDINLAMMPTRAQQETFLSDLQQRITARMLIPVPGSPPLSRLQAEQEILKEIEAELIQFVLSPNRRSEVPIS